MGYQNSLKGQSSAIQLKNKNQRVGKEKEIPAINVGQKWTMNSKLTITRHLWFEIRGRFRVVFWLTPIGNSWKTNADINQKFHFSGWWATGGSAQFLDNMTYWLISDLVSKRYETFKFSKNFVTMFDGQNWQRKTKLRYFFEILRPILIVRSADHAVLGSLLWWLISPQTKWH